MAACCYYTANVAVVQQIPLQSAGILAEAEEINFLLITPLILIGLLLFYVKMEYFKYLPLTFS